MPTEHERPEMFARPPKMPSTLKRGPAYGGGTDMIKKQQGISERPKAIPKPRLHSRAGIAVSTDYHQAHVPARLDALDMPYDRAEQHTLGVHGVKQRHAEPLRSHPITNRHTKLRTPHQQGETEVLPWGSAGSDASDTTESKISAIQRADSPIDVRSAKHMKSTAVPADWKMINKGPVVLSPTPPPTMRDDELFLDTKSTCSSSLIQATWSHVQHHSPEVSDASSLAQPLSAHTISWDEDALEMEKAYVEMPRLPGFEPLALTLLDGPSLHEEVFGRPADEEVNIRGIGGRVADNLEEYTRYTGWIERE